MNSSASFPKAERLKSRKAIQALFESGQSEFHYPLKFIYRTFTPFEERPLIRAAVSVSKRNFKKAVDRNHIKRQLREIFRLHKEPLYARLPEGLHMDMMIIFIGKQQEVYQKMEKAYLQIIDQYL